MTDHLPECPANWGVGDMPEGPCVLCEMLRACEQRVLESAEQYIKAHMEGKRVGFSLGVHAAREAVAAAISELKPILSRDYPRLSARDGAQEAENRALAAVDALRGGS